MNSNNLTNEQKFLENYKKRIIKDVLKTLCKDYKIYDDNDTLQNSETLYKNIMNPKVVKRCIGVTNTQPISQCTRNAVDVYDYCKTHLYKMCFQKNEATAETTTDVEYIFTSQKENVSTKLKKKFIENSFYFIDDKYIYDTNYVKVGYIQDNNYILTSDPFILETI